MKRIVIATVGSLGDIYPYIPIAMKLRDKGYRVEIAANSDHKDVVEKNSIGFIKIGPDLEEVFESRTAVMSKIMHPVEGPEFVVRKVIMPNVRRSYEDLSSAVDNASLVVTHPITYGALLFARKRQIPFIATVLAPLSFFSRYDPPAMPGSTWIPAMHRALGPAATKLLIQAMKMTTYGWLEPYRRLQTECGLPVDRRHPLFEGQFSPLKNLGLFSPVFGPPQSDWPQNTVATGFPFFENDVADEGAMRTVWRFLQEGPPPVVLTLGSSAVWDAGEFWAVSVEGLKRANLRGILLTGNSPGKRVPSDLPDSIIALDYLPHARIFKEAALIVHQGGIGTTAQALRSGRPQLVMPYSHDQYDNAERVRRLGCGLIARRAKFTPQIAADFFMQLKTARYQAQCMQTAERIAAENGAETAANEIASVVT